ncbi:hypothetical protein [Mesorhizobium sp. B263B2A]|uniref:hypothetical protein n=1 Tax=Mesorhizobium sp. B263B2A TaxID=2876669 RepID=UPI001CD07A61|nr:hypothetical protein [Mesorhizobium sp. B263B2A]MCA0033889.1 hypothetical protein [Mesorhizobium sp. B263B2A]
MDGDLVREIAERVHHVLVGLASVFAELVDEVFAPGDDLVLCRFAIIGGQGIPYLSGRDFGVGQIVTLHRLGQRFLGSLDGREKLILAIGDGRWGGGRRLRRKRRGRPEKGHETDGPKSRESSRP